MYLPAKLNIQPQKHLGLVVYTLSLSDMKARVYPEIEKFLTMLYGLTFQP